MTTEALPAPLVPADVDLSGYRWMKLDLARLFNSDFFALATGDEFRAGFTLWGRAIYQVPAGSLPDDDRTLAALAGYGRDVKGWGKVRAMAMRGWFRASDGRLYHHTVAETVLDAWKERVKYRDDQERLKRWRAEKRNASETRFKTRSETVNETPTETDTETRFETPEETRLKPEDRDRDRDKESTSAALNPTAARANGFRPGHAEPEPPKKFPTSQAALDVIALFDQRSAEHFGQQTRAFPAATDAIIAQRWLDAGAEITLIDSVFNAKFGARKAKGKGAVGSLSYLDQAVAEAIQASRLAIPAMLRRDKAGRLVAPNLNLVAG